MKTFFLLLTSVVFAQVNMPQTMQDSPFRIDQSNVAAGQGEDLTVYKMFFSQPFKSTANLDGSVTTSRFVDGTLQGNEFILPLEVVQGQRKILSIWFSLTYSPFLKTTSLTRVRVLNHGTGEDYSSTQLGELSQMMYIFFSLLEPAP